MSHSWRQLFGLANEQAKAKVEDQLNSNADPKIQMNMAIQEMREQYGKLHEAAAEVMANRDRAVSRRAQIERDINRLKQSAVAAQKAGRTDDARRFALDLDNQMQIAQGLDQEIPALQQNADAAEQHLKAFADAMNEKMQERIRLMSQLDQAKANEQLHSAMQTFSDLSGSLTTPSFAEISEKIEKREAVSRNSVALDQTDPNLAELDAHVREHNDRADSILAELTGGSETPAVGAGS
jgi:phage shock protein A